MMQKDKQFHNKIQKVDGVAQCAAKTSTKISKKKKKCQNTRLMKWMLGQGEPNPK